MIISMFKKYLVPVLLFLVSIFVIGKNLDKPFEGLHDWNGARYGNIARNYVRYGFGITRFAQVENSGEVAQKDFVYYTHFPPLLPILISISYRFFGISEWATRLIPFLATAGSITLLFLIGRTIFNSKVGLAASVFALATPMVRYFGKNPVHEPLAMFFGLISIFGSLLIIKKDKKGWYLTIVGLIGVFLTNWSGIFLLPAISIIILRSVKFKQIAILWLIGIALGLWHFFHIYLVTGSIFGGGLVDALMQRTSLGGTAILTKFSLLEFVARVRIWASTLFTITLLLAAVFGVFRILKTDLYTKKFFLALFVWGVGYPLVLPNATFIHNYFIFGALPFLALAASYGVAKVFTNVKLFILVVILLTLGIWFERNSFVKALESSSSDRIAFEIGKKMNVEVPKTDLVFIIPFDFAASRLPILSFYSDRKITFNSNSGYNWVVEIDQTNGSYEILPRKR